MSSFIARPQQVSLARYLAILTVLVRIPLVWLSAAETFQEKHILHCIEPSFVAGAFEVTFVLSKQQIFTLSESAVTSTGRDAVPNLGTKLQAFVQWQIVIRMLDSLQEALQRPRGSANRGLVAQDLIRAFLWVTYNGTKAHKACSNFHNCGRIEWSLTGSVAVSKCAPERACYCLCNRERDAANKTLYTAMLRRHKVSQKSGR